MAYVLRVDLCAAGFLSGLLRTKSSQGDEASAERVEQLSTRRRLRYCAEAFQEGSPDFAVGRALRIYARPVATPAAQAYRMAEAQ